MFGDNARRRERERERTTQRELDKQPSGRRQIENSGMAVKVVTSLRLWCKLRGYLSSTKFENYHMIILFTWYQYTVILLRISNGNDDL